MAAGSRGRLTRRQRIAFPVRALVAASALALFSLLAVGCIDSRTPTATPTPIPTAMPGPTRGGNAEPYRGGNAEPYRDGYAGPHPDGDAEPHPDGDAHPHPDGYADTQPNANAERSLRRERRAPPRRQRQLPDRQRRRLPLRRRRRAPPRRQSRARSRPAKSPSRVLSPNTFPGTAIRPIPWPLCRSGSSGSGTRSSDARWRRRPGSPTAWTGGRTTQSMDCSTWSTMTPRWRGGCSPTRWTSRCRSRNTLLLATLGRMSAQHTETFELLVGQPWFTDGLDAEERAFIIAVSHTTGVEDLYRSLLADRFGRSAAISLPLAGEVTIWVFSNDDAPALNDHVLAAVERGVRGAERLMGAPYPLTDLIALSVDADDHDLGYGGVNWGDSLVFLRGERIEPPDYDLILYHEIAHFWLGGDIGPFWLYEGGANVVAAYVRADGQLLAVEESMIAYCRENGVPNVHAISAARPLRIPVAQSTCGYLFGEYFLTTLFNTVGEAAFSAALRELYESYVSYAPFATDEQVYRVFLKHTPPDREAAFLDIYRRLHGGPFLTAR